MATTTNPKHRPAPGSGFPLNAEQRAAVEHGEGPLLVVAGAGTGKTRVITERIRHLLESNPDLAGENILGLTFTDKAAAEMKHRVVKAAGDERAEGVWLSTFHSFCLEKILPRGESRNSAARRHRPPHSAAAQYRRAGSGDFPAAGRAGGIPAEISQKFFSRCQDELVTPDDYQRYVEGLRREHEAHKSGARAGRASDRRRRCGAAGGAGARLSRQRAAAARAATCYTFGAQLLQAVELLRADARLLARMREQYRYILVDEFQDTNIAQLELLWLLAGGRRNILAVGDDDQAIYRFRGASFGSFTIFLETILRRYAHPAGAAARPDRAKSISFRFRRTTARRGESCAWRAR